MIYLLNIIIVLGFFSLCYSQLNVIPDTSYFIARDDGFNLIMASDHGDSASVKMLIKRGADVNSATIDGVTPLMYAAQNGSFNIVKLLTDSGADLNKTPYNGATALIVSAKHNYYEIAEFLIRKGADPNIRDMYGVTAMHYAAAYNHYDIMDMLIFYGSDTELPDLKGNTPIISASYNNCLEAVDLLIQNGANINSSDNNGNTALMVSIMEGNTDISNFLIEKGAYLNLLNKKGLSALAIAVLNSDMSLVKLLSQNGADVNLAKTKEGDIIDLAESRGNSDMVSYLKSQGAQKTKYFKFIINNFGLNIDFNKTDYMNGLVVGASDLKHKLTIKLGFNFRPWPNRVVNEFSNMNYQFWERRYYTHLGLEKRFTFARKSIYFQTGPLLGIKEGFTFGSYRGSTMKPSARLFTSPEAGYYLQFKGFDIRFGYHYMNFKTPEIKPGRFSLTLLFISDWKTQKSILNQKRIEWI